MSRITGPFDRKSAEEIVDRALDHEDMREFLMQYLTGDISELPMATAIACLAQSLAERMHEEEREEARENGVCAEVEEPGVHPMMKGILSSHGFKRSG